MKPDLPAIRKRLAEASRDCAGLSDDEVLRVMLSRVVFQDHALADVEELLAWGEGLKRDARRSSEERALEELRRIVGLATDGDADGCPLEEFGLGDAESQVSTRLLELERERDEALGKVERLQQRLIDADALPTFDECADAKHSQDPGAVAAIRSVVVDGERPDLLKARIVELESKELENQRTIEDLGHQVDELRSERDEALAALEQRQRLWTEVSFAMSHRTTEHLRKRYAGNTPEWINGECDMLTAIFRERDEALEKVAELAEEVDGLNRVLGCFARTAKSVTCSHLHDEHPARLFAESVIEEWEARSAE